MIKLFPTIEDVFIDNFDGNSKHFLPIASIDLAEIDKSFKGQVHIVYFNNDQNWYSFVEFGLAILLAIIVKKKYSYSMTRQIKW